MLLVILGSAITVQELMKGKELFIYRAQIMYGSSISSQLKGDSLHVEFSMVPYSLFIQSCGVHVIHKHEENAKDHPNMIHVDFNFRFYDPNLEF
jgi:hypothetical protein